MESEGNEVGGWGGGEKIATVYFVAHRAVISGTHLLQGISRYGKNECSITFLSRGDVQVAVTTQKEA